MTRFTTRYIIPRTITVVAFLAIGSTTFLASTTFAQTTWSGLAGSGAWGTPGNWSSGLPAAGVTAAFNDAGNGQNAIALGGISRPLANLLFDTSSVAAYTLATGTLNFDGGGSITIDNDVATVQTINTLITTNGAFTITDNSPLSTGSGALLIGAGISLTAGNPLIVDITDALGKFTIGASGSAGISGAAGFIKNGPGTFVFASVNNAYSGMTTVSGGAIEFSNGGRLGSNAVGNSIVINNNAILRSTSGATNTLGTNQSIAVGSGGATLDVTNSGGTLAITGAINGTNTTVTKNGLGLVTLSADNSGLTGSNFVVNAGALRVTTLNSLGLNTSSVTLNNSLASGGATGGMGTQLSVQGGSIFPSTLALVVNTDGGGDYRGTLVSDSGSNTWNGPITLQGTSSAQFYSTAASQTFTVNGNITADSGFTGGFTVRGNTSSANGVINGVINLGTGAFGKTDSSTWTINSTGNSWSTTTITTGTLKIGANDALPTTAPLVMGSNSNTHAFDLSGKNQTVANLTIGGTGSRTITNSSGTASTLTIANLVDGFFNDTDPNKSKITGNLSLAKSGTASLVLNGNNLYTGTTSVTQGSLFVGGSHTGGSQYTVSSGATLGGTATINSAIQIDAGGALSPGSNTPGSTIGTMAVASATIGGKLVVEYNGDLNSIDLLGVTNGLAFSAGATVDFDNVGTNPLSGGPYIFAAYGAGQLTGTITSVDLPAGYTIVPNYMNLNQIALVASGTLPGDHNHDGKVNAADYVLWRHDPASYGNNQGYLDWRAHFGDPMGSGAGGPSSSAAVPEPSSLVVICLIGALAIVRRVRTRASI